ncbi:MAG: hypothetical protein WBD16_15710 [Pyrinomonadaceae bacterium]
MKFAGKLPAPEDVDKIFRDELEKVVKKHPETDALGYACSEKSCLTENQYSGDLVYKAAQKKIVTADEANGIKATGEDNGSYYVLTEEISPTNLPMPTKSMLFLSLVFPEPPHQKGAYQAIIVEIDKVRDMHLGVVAYVKVGDRNKKTSWYQVRGSDGEVIFATYDPESDRIYTKVGIILRNF